MGMAAERTFHVFHGFHSFHDSNNNMPETCLNAREDTTISRRTMDSRKQLLETFQFSSTVPPPRYERQFSEEVIQKWRSQGFLNEDTSPEAFFGLDERVDLPVQWHRCGSDKAVVKDSPGLDEFRRGYNPANRDRFPEDWRERIAALSQRACPLEVSPWAEGFFQVLGISDGATLVQALTTLCDRPDLAESQMEHYAWFLEELIDRTLPGTDVDYALYYVPIASNHAPVISPKTYRRFVLPAMRRVSERLENHGVSYRFVYSSGAVEDIIPIWLDAGINGLVLTHAAKCGLPYKRLRREFARSILLFGGVDWRAVMNGPEALDRELEENTRPVLEQGGYVPHLDDTVRENMPFENYRYYREKLDELVGRVFG